jgi:predicted MPP superfamily phosphohydrolase
VQTAEKLRILLLFAFLAGIYVPSAWMLARAAWGRIRRVRETPSRRYRWARRIFFSLSALGILCAVYARFVEPFRLTVSRVRIESPRWTGKRPLRIVHFSDLHCDPRPRLETRLPRAIAALDPDVIVFTGDAVNSKAGLPVFLECMSRIARIAPTFAVRGNFDAADRGLFEGTGVQELDGKTATLRVAGGRALLAGLSASGGERAPDLIASAPPEPFLVLLYHYPDLFPELAARGRVDLYCAGHTHGGQVALPLYGALVTLSRHGKRYEAGLYEACGSRLHVSRGIGMEGGAAPRMRFWAPPEITLIEVAPGR